MKSTESLLTIPRIRGLHGIHLEITTLPKSHSMDLTYGYIWMNLTQVYIWMNLTQGYICMYVCLTQLKVTVIRNIR